MAPTQGLQESPVRRVVTSYLAAIKQGDFGRARQFLSDQGFRFRGPLESIEGADRFVERYWGAGQITLDLRVRKIFQDGPELCAIFDIETQISERRSTPVAMYVRVEGDKITEMEVFHDARGYAEMFDPQD